MSGIFSFFDTYGFSLNKTINICKKMGHTIYDRVLDYYGLWYHQNYFIVNIYQRIRITNISKSSHLPILLSSERYIVCFNDDIYNDRDLCYGIDILAKVLELE